MTMDRYVILPADGFTCQGPRPSQLVVNEVPVGVSDADLKVLVDALCASTRGLSLGLGEGPAGRPFYTRNYRILTRLAAERGIPVPKLPAPPRPQGHVNVVDGVACDDQNRPLPPQAST